MCYKKRDNNQNTSCSFSAKIINEKSDYLIDVWGTDNLLFNSKNKKSHLIDLSQRYRKLFETRSIKNSVDDIISLVLAPMIHFDALKVLDTKEQDELITISQLIIKKTINAGKTTGLKRNLDEAVIRFEVFDKFHKMRRGITDTNKREEFIKFQKLYSLI